MYIIITVIIIVIVVIITRNAVLIVQQQTVTATNEKSARKETSEHVQTTQVHRKIALSKSFWNFCEEIPKNPRYQKKKISFPSWDLNSKVCVSGFNRIPKRRRGERRGKKNRKEDRPTTPMMHLGLVSVSVDGGDTQQAHGKPSEGRRRESKGDLGDNKTTDSTLRKSTERRLTERTIRKLHVWLWGRTRTRF